MARYWSRKHDERKYTWKKSLIVYKQNGIWPVAHMLQKMMKWPSVRARAHQGNWLTAISENCYQPELNTCYCMELRKLRLSVSRPYSHSRTNPSCQAFLLHWKISGILHIMRIVLPHSCNEQCCHISLIKRLRPYITLLESRLMRSPCCLFVNTSYKLLSAWTNLYETWYVYHGTWAHLNGTLHKSLPSVFVSVYVSHLSLLGNGSLKCIPPF
jgi:hypothetical protein